MARHKWIESTLGHGELMCRWCHVTNREATALNILDSECTHAPRHEPSDPPLIPEEMTDEKWVIACAAWCGYDPQAFLQFCKKDQQRMPEGSRKAWGRVYAAIREDIVRERVDLTVWQHKKTGGLYRIIAYGKIEATLEPSTIYQNMHTGEVWVRPKSEFEDGRFIVYEPK